MGNYNDFDLDIKKVQGENDIGPASITTTIILSIKTCTEALSCDGGCSGSDTCGITCGGRGAVDTADKEIFFSSLRRKVHTS